MIRNLAQLLELLATEEKRKLDEFAKDAGVRHPTILGDMYEGLARLLAAKTIPDGHDFRVVRGQVANSHGDLSRQIDCMIVEGEGQKILLTDHWIYPIENVLAMIEVKKTLYGRDLNDAIDLFIDLRERICELRQIQANLLRDAWKAITATPLPNQEQLKQLNTGGRLLYSTLMGEAIFPIRVIIGFDGYKSERMLRQGFIEVLERRHASARAAGQPMAKLGPLVLPSLIIGRNAALMKLNGMPYVGPYWPSDGAWGFYASRGKQPLHVLLEVLWTRLNYYYGLPASVFGEDLDLDAVTLLGKATPGSANGVDGWTIDLIEVNESDMKTDDKPWMPSILSKAAYDVMNVLCEGLDVIIDDETFQAFLESQGTTASTLADELGKARLATIRSNRFELLTDHCRTGIDPVHGFVAAEDKTGRFTRWMLKRVQELKRKRTP